MKNTIIISTILIAFANHLWADSLWEKTKQVTGSTIDMVGATASSVGKAVSGEKEPIDKTRTKINSMSKRTLNKLIQTYPNVKRHFEQAVAYAVFDSRRLSLLLAMGRVKLNVF